MNLANTNVKNDVSRFWNSLMAKQCICLLLFEQNVCLMLWPKRQQSPKSYFERKDQCHKVIIYLGVIWKGIITGVCIPNMKSQSYIVQMLKRRLTFTTDRHRDRQTVTNRHACIDRWGANYLPVYLFVFAITNEPWKKLLMIETSYLACILN